MQTALRLAAVVVVALGAWMGAVTSDAFRVTSGGGFEGPPVPGAPAGWEKGCLGWRHRVVMMDAEWEQCVGVPVGPRRCFAYADHTLPAPSGVQVPDPNLAWEQVPCETRGG